MKEHEIQKLVVSYLRLNGWLTICTDMSIGSMFLGKNQKQRIKFFTYIKKQGYTNGSTDLIAVKDSEILFIELKTEKGKLSTEQAKMSSLLPNYHIIRSLEDIEALIK